MRGEKLLPLIMAGKKPNESELSFITKEAEWDNIIEELSFIER